MSGPADLALALELADLADAVTLPRFRASDLVVSTKPDLSPVSDADRAAETAIRRRLAEARPGDAVLGEEFGETGPGLSGPNAVAGLRGPNAVAGLRGPNAVAGLRGLNAVAAPRRWVLDPLDGTKNFVRGIPVWACLIALEEEGVPVVGVVSAPALGRRWWAATGAGAFANGDRVRVSGIANLGDAQLSHDSIVEFEDEGLGPAALDLERRCWRARGLGDFWSHVLVAEGAVDVAVEPAVALWDVAPLQVIVEEAGGRFTDLHGRARADGGSALSTNGRLHDSVLGIFANH